MSKREIRILVLIMVGITLLGFIFGRVILPRIIMWSIGSKVELPDDPYALELGNQSHVCDDDFQVTDGRIEDEEQVQSETENREYMAEPERLLIDVDVSVQVVKVFMDEELIKEMAASTGVEGHETPLGTFEIQNRGLWFFNEKYGQGAKYWVSFKDWGIYLFHSLAMDKDREIIEEEAEKLGQPASHGCIRLKVEDAKWIYDNIPEKTKVLIHD
ncbi:MAG TPA: L,D-transpeptidase [Bacillota bacterium]|nr:L,D-transpeptidase [Bacillota bacterium]HQD74876.1 L,D-transpeptidase [Bacillota bacterium]